LKLQRLFQDAFALEISKDVIQRAPQSRADFTYRGYQPRAYAAALRYFMKIMDYLADHPIGINAFVGGAAADLYGPKYSHANAVANASAEAILQDASWSPASQATRCRNGPRSEQGVKVAVPR
jgi:hypothetical protein